MDDSLIIVSRIKLRLFGNLILPSYVIVELFDSDIVLQHDPKSNSV
ncbi:MAG: hypothetical protein OEM53_08475 [Nitrosopumilus sp.]|nr:hypothetical protein [Nitrosopumilus sp.]